MLYSSNILYGLISFDGYPDCMMPAISKIDFVKLFY